MVGPMNVFCDNKSDKKHNVIAYHQTHEAIAAGIIQVAWEDGCFNIAVLTKLISFCTITQALDISAGHTECGNPTVRIRDLCPWVAPTHLRAWVKPLRILVKLLRLRLTLPLRPEALNKTGIPTSAGAPNAPLSSGSGSNPSGGTGGSSGAFHGGGAGPNSSGGIGGSSGAPPATAVAPVRLLVFTQDPDYITIKERVAKRTVDGAPTEGVATIGIAVETLKVAANLTSVLVEQLR